MARRIDRRILWPVLLVGAAWAGRRVMRRWRQFSFQGQRVLIAGGSRGLGLVMARQLVAEGAKVAICARSAEQLERAAEDLRSRGGEVLAIPCDISDPRQIEQTVRQVEDHWGGIDVLINNAGIIQVGPLESMTLEDYRRAMDVHFWGPLQMILAALPGMRRRGAGRIVNIASIGGKVSVPHLLPYNASKFALVGLSEGLRTELVPAGIYVTTVCPGMMRTGSPVRAEFKGKHKQEFTWFTVADVMPLLSISAERAASEILDACRNGEAEVVLTLPAKVASLIHGVAPGLTAEVLSVAGRLLPSADGTSQVAHSGSESRSKWLPRWAWQRSQEAARRNNEIAPPTPASQLPPV